MKFLRLTLLVVLSFSLVALASATGNPPNYALNTAPPSNYGPITIGLTTTWWNAEGPLANRVRLTNGDKTYNWGDVDGWDAPAGTVSLIADLGSLKTDIRSAGVWNVVDYGSAMGAISTARVYGSTVSATGPWTFYGNLQCWDDPTTNTAVFGEAHRWAASSPINLSAQWVKFELDPLSPGWWFLLSEFEVRNDATIPVSLVDFETTVGGK